MRLEQRIEKLECTTPSNNASREIIIISCTPGGGSSRYRLTEEGLVAIETSTVEPDGRSQDRDQ